jgi:ABC-type uncharacterized transport system permease subunit
MVISSPLAALLYLAACLAAIRATDARRTGASPPVPARVEVDSLLLLAGFVVHGVALHAAMLAPGVLRFGFALALSATFWVGVMILWIEGLSVRIEALRIVVLPVAALAAILPMVFPGSDFTAESARPLFLPHLVIGTLAYGVLMLAALHAILMTTAERALRASEREGDSLFARWSGALPPLLVLERILFRFIGTGFVFLTLTLLSGVLFSEEVFGRPLRLDHKTVFGLLAWVLFAVLLAGRVRWGWRGRTALRLTLAGFFVLVLAYVGSRFVIEVLLGRG